MFQAVAFRAHKALLVCALALATGMAAAPALARQPQVLEPVAVVSLVDLPAQGRSVYARIHRGGPFAFEKDGMVFGNRERLLPPQPRGYYREYTVKTPGVAHRGARRIVCGGAARTPDACYYTSDHYASFREIRP